ncbi:unnamed protein product [Phytophthora fragariaefolia]|uniref:Unnamed protein product n=1 Tax=Phytophthora fragariaefolia TaxID=1490495 RepID=A0A9W6XL53_9STRA|nr:unnamed protein product [Phytophthora fragariaefolia]
MFVDDQTDITTSIAGLQERAEVTNVFSGNNGTGGVFGAAKSFVKQVGGNRTSDLTISLNDGMGHPKPVQVVAPAQGFKHLGIQQGGVDQWESSIAGTWARLVDDLQRIRHMDLPLAGYRYIVNCIWIPRVRYRMVLGGAIQFAPRIDTFIRQAAREVLRLPYSLPLYVYYDRENGLGLGSCEQDANVYRFQLLLRILNSPHLPVHHLLVEQIEYYQLRAGLTENPFENPIRPPPRMQSWHVLADSSGNLSDLVGCLLVPPGAIPYQLRISRGQWVVVSQQNFNGPTPQIVAHEIGYCIDEPRQHELGTLIRIQWWQQRPRGSDIWYARTSQRTAWEFEDVCVPIVPTFLPQPPRTKQRVIVWRDTAVDGQHGVNDKVALDEAAARGQLRHDTVLFHGHPLPMRTTCTACHRYRGAIWCKRCRNWHHMQCIGLACEISILDNSAVDMTRLQSVQYTRESTDTIHVEKQVGGGSVLDANTHNASGGWAFHDDSGTVLLGKLRIHWSDITSTRCELHALLAGIFAGGDQGAPICDNKSAIHILLLARRLATSEDTFLPYRNPHRITPIGSRSAL